MTVRDPIQPSQWINLQTDLITGLKEPSVREHTKADGFFLMGREAVDERRPNLL